MLSIICWRWKPAPGYRSTFSPDTVNVLRNMVRRHYLKPHRFICITDDPEGINKDVEIVPLWKEHADLQSPHGRGNPSCYRRLRAFAADAGAILGDRFVSMDLDCVITGDLSPLWDREDDFVIWGDTNPNTLYNGSMMLMTAGCRRQVWEDFDPVQSPLAAKRAGHFGSDQAWISHCLGPGEKKWTSADGVYSFRNHVRPAACQLPIGARIVFFHGQHDPWTPGVQSAVPWIKSHYH